MLQRRKTDLLSGFWEYNTAPVIRKMYCTGCVDNTSVICSVLNSKAVVGSVHVVIDHDYTPY